MRNRLPRARHDIDRPARMDEADRARQRDLVGLHDDDLALDAAQIGTGVARGDAAAVDHHAVEIPLPCPRIVFDRNAGRPEHIVQGGQDLARIDMAFLRKEQALRKTPGQGGLERGDLLRADALVSAGQPRVALEVRAIARMRDEQRAVERRLRQRLPPQIERPQTEARNHRLGRLALAQRREHPARPMARGLRHGRIAAFIERDPAPRFREQESLPCARNARADHADGRRKI